MKSIATRQLKDTIQKHIAWMRQSGSWQNIHACNNKGGLTVESLQLSWFGLQEFDPLILYEDVNKIAHKQSC